MLDKLDREVVGAAGRVMGPRPVDQIFHRAVEASQESGACVVVCVVTVSSLPVSPDIVPSRSGTLAD